MSSLSTENTIQSALEAEVASLRHQVNDLIRVSTQTGKIILELKRDNVALKESIEILKMQLNALSLKTPAPQRFSAFAHPTLFAVATPAGVVGVELPDQEMLSCMDSFRLPQSQART